MIFTQYDSLEELTDFTSDLIIAELKKKPAALVCAATGNSPTGTYKKLIEKKDQIKVDDLSFVKLDEWYGLPMDHPGSCEYYLQENLLKPLHIKPEQYTAFISDADDREAECERIQNYLNEHGPVDLCILGIGLNGHIAFNEPAAELSAGVHVSRLTLDTLKHSMVAGVEKELKYGLTLGLTDILQSKKILLIVNGKHKRGILNKLLSSNISTYLPASFLWLHPDVHCVYTEE